MPLGKSNLYILGNKKIRVGQKIRVGRVIGNKHFSFSALVHTATKSSPTILMKSCLQKHTSS